MKKCTIRRAVVRSFRLLKLLFGFVLSEAQ
jgi:hypothetical protein